MRKLGFWSAMFITGILTLPVLAMAQVQVTVIPAEMDSPAVGEQFTVDIVVNDVQDLYGFQFDLQFNKDALQVVDEKVEEGDFLNSDGVKTNFAIQKGIFNNVGLIASVTNTRLRSTTFEIDPNTGDLIETVLPESLEGLDGTGTLATVTFIVVDDQLESTLLLKNLKLASPGGEIASEALSGVVKSVAVNQAPTAVIDGPAAANTGDTVEFSGANSTDDGSIVSYEWNFGDGGTAAGETASHVFADGGTYTVTLTVTDDMGETGVATLDVVVSATLTPVITEHAAGSPMLALEVDYPTENEHGHAYIAVWGAGDFAIEAGMFLEYQIAMYSGNPTFQAGVDIHTSDGATLRDATDAAGNPVVDQNGIGAHPNNDLSAFARDKWYHRKISLDALAGKSIHHVTVATDSDTHAPGKFRAYVDNIQITTADGQVLAIYVDQDTLPANNSATNTDPGPGGFSGVDNPQLSAAVTDVAVEPAGKLPVTWGQLKKTVR